MVQGLLGHAHSRTTQRYAHLAHEMLLEAAEHVSIAIAAPSQPGATVPAAGNGAASQS